MSSVFLFSFLAVISVYGLNFVSATEDDSDILDELKHSKTLLPGVKIADKKLTREEGQIIYEDKYNGYFKPSPGCSFKADGLKEGDYGNISSPQYPKDYPAHLDCLWRVESENGTKIRGVFFDFETQPAGNGTTGDVVYLSKDGAFSSIYRIVGDLNDNTPLVLESDKNEMILRFRSDISENRRGFKFLYTVEKDDSTVEEQTAYDGICGKINNPPEEDSSRVIGSNPTKPHQYPWMVGLLIDGASFCGGTLIDNSHILTAAHCTYRSKRIAVIIGAHNLSEPIEPSRRVARITAENIFTHPDYIFDENTLTHDIAILRLPKPLTYTDKISPICLPTRRQMKYANVEDVVQLSGWGKTSDDDPGISSVLQHTKPSTVMTNKECRLYFEHYITGNIMCMHATPTNAGCRGDSGGPLFNIVKASGETPEHAVQYGVTSFTGISCEEGLPFAFTRVTAFLDYVEEITGRKL